MKDLREVKIIIGWQIIRNLSMKTIRISSLAYIKDLLKDKNLINYNTLTILMKASSFIEINKLDNYNKTNLSDYQKLIKKFIYLVYKMRPNIAFVVEKFSKHNTNSRKDHLQAAKKIIHYLKNMIHLELVYRKCSDRSFSILLVLYDLIKYSNSNFT